MKVLRLLQQASNSMLVEVDGNFAQIADPADSVLFKLYYERKRLDDQAPVLSWQEKKTASDSVLISSGRGASNRTSI